MLMRSMRVQSIEANVGNLESPTTNFNHRAFLSWAQARRSVSRHHPHLGNSRLGLLNSRWSHASIPSEVRRGVDRAEIHCLAFSSTAQWLAVSSDRGCVHLYSLKVNSEGSPGNEKSRSVSSYVIIKGVLPQVFQLREVSGSVSLV